MSDSCLPSQLELYPILVFPLLLGYPITELVLLPDSVQRGAKHH